MAANPIEPTRTLITFLFAVSAASLVLMITSTISGYHSTCVDHGAFGQLVEQRLRPDSGAQLREGVALYLNSARLCANDPSVGQRVLAMVVDMLDYLFLCLTLVLAAMMFRAVDKHGLFSAQAVGWLRVVGWAVLAGTPAVSLLAAFAAAELLDSMLVSSPFDALWIDQWELSFTAIVLGTVLISLARILRVSTGMREDLEGTV